MSLTPTRMDIYRTALPMRGFSHAAASRNVAEAVIVRVQFDDGSEGWGETLPREYVTGETIDSVIADLQDIIWPIWAGRDMSADPPGTPITHPVHNGRCINAAICAFDLACMGRLFDDVAKIPPMVLAELGGRSRARGEIDVRVSGVIGTGKRRKVARKIRMMRWIGLEDFKLKLSGDDRQDARNVQQASQMLRRAIRLGQGTLRVDVNGAWDLASTPERVAALMPWGVCVVEQPTYCSASELVVLARRRPWPLMVAERLLARDVAAVLLAEPERIWWNIRLSKNGGLTGAMELARVASDNNITFVVGCMVGESGILSACQRRLLQLGPGPRFVEGNYGKWLLAADVTKPSLNFSYGGKCKPLSGPGLGVAVDLEKLNSLGQLIATLQA